MSDLTTFRDHCRMMADPNAWAGAHRLPRAISASCDPRLLGHVARNHTECEWGWQSCRCTCHDDQRPKPPTVAERALWTRLADEIDAYLAGQLQTDFTDHTEPLWETT